MISAIKTLAVFSMAFVPLALAGFFKACVDTPKPSRSVAEPGWVSFHADRAWRGLALWLTGEVQARREAIRGQLETELKSLPGLEIPGTNEAQMALTGKHGKLPEILVDEGHGAIFPMPLSAPHRFSWFQIAAQSRSLLVELGRIERAVERWKKLPPSERAARFDELASHWTELAARLSRLAQEARYLETWVPQLERQWNEARAKHKLPWSFETTRALTRETLDPKTLEDLRESLRPRRVMERSFLPDDLADAPGGLVILPILTDVRDRRFLAEVEGALATHWNQSPWARAQRVSFHIQWTHVGHVNRIPDDMAMMSTGGLTTHVKDQALILAPDRITPRTLAHELGHLIGFDDCYLRTIGGQGIFGLGVLEWDNPLYPDDLMCDNTVGVARAETW